MLGLQSYLVEQCERDCKHTWVLPESNRGVELPVNVTAGHANRAHNARIVHEYFSGRDNDRNGCRRRDVAFLECVPSENIVSKQWSFEIVAVGPGNPLIVSIRRTRSF